MSSGLGLSWLGRGSRLELRRRVVPYRDVRSPLTDLGLSTSAILGLGRSGLTQVVCLRVLGLAVARTVCNCVPQMRKLVHWGIRRFTLDLESHVSVCVPASVLRARGIPTHYFDNVHCGHTARQERDAYGCHRVSCHRVPPSAYGCLPPSATECHRFAYGPATECIWLPPSLWSCHRVPPSLQTWWNGACHLSSSLV